MRKLKKWGTVMLAFCMAFGFAACNGDEEVSLSLTKEEMDATMKGNWKVEQAGAYNTDIAGEEHVTDLVESSLDYLTIDETHITLHFDPAVEVEYLEGENMWREQVTEYTFTHQGYSEVKGAIWFNSERSEEDAFMSVMVDWTEETWSSVFVFTLYGKEKDESFATNLMLRISNGLTYWLSRMDD